MSFPSMTKDDSVEVTAVDIRRPGDDNYSRSHGYYDSYSHRYVTNRRQSDIPTGHGIVYVSVDGESLWQDMAQRTTRPYDVWRPHVVEALQNAGVDVTKLRWSQKAGCGMCPCSPGFIMEGPGTVGMDVWITVEATFGEPQTTDVETAVDRLVQLDADPTLPFEIA